MGGSSAGFAATLVGWLGLVAVLSARTAGAAGPPDLSTPGAAAKAFAEAVLAGDAAAAKLTVVPGAESERLVTRLAEDMGAFVQLRGAMDAAYKNADSRRMQAPLASEIDVDRRFAKSLVVDGDRASYVTSVDGPPRLRLRKLGKEWRVDPASLPIDPRTLDENSALAKAARTILPDVRAGKIRPAADKNGHFGDPVIDVWAALAAARNRAEKDPPPYQPPPVDLSSPRAAAETFAVHMVCTDFAGAAEALVLNEEQAAAFKTLAAARETERRFMAALRAQFPAEVPATGMEHALRDAAERAKQNVAESKARVQVDGDVATVTTEGGGAPWRARRIAGKWKLELPAEALAQWTQPETIARLRAEAELRAKLVRRLEAGEFKSLAEFQAAYGRAAREAQSPPAGGATEGTRK